jgi:hypothetical protein
MKARSEFRKDEYFFKQRISTSKKMCTDISFDIIRIRDCDLKLL